MLPIPGYTRAIVSLDRARVALSGNFFRVLDWTAFLTGLGMKVAASSALGNREEARARRRQGLTEGVPSPSRLSELSRKFREPIGQLLEYIWEDARPSSSGSVGR